MPKTLAIVGSAKTTRHLAPFDDPNVTIWGINEALAWTWMKRAEAMFQMHQRWVFTRPHNANHWNYWNWLQNVSAVCNRCEGTKLDIRLHPGQDVPCPECLGADFRPTGVFTPAKRQGVTLYMHEAYPDIPGAVAYPLAEVQAALCPGRAYFTSTVAYMLALAIYQGFARIEMYGVHMSMGSEYAYQRDGVTYWLGRAEGAGIEVVLPEACELLQGRLYGYDGGRMIERLFFEMRRAKLEEKEKEADIAFRELAGKVALAGQQLETRPHRRDLQEQLQRLLSEERAALVKKAALSGAKQECEAYIREYDVLARAAGNAHANPLGEYHLADELSPSDSTALKELPEMEVELIDA